CATVRRGKGTTRTLDSCSHLMLGPPSADGVPAVCPAVITGKVAHRSHGIHVVRPPAHPRLFHATLHHQLVGTLHRFTANGIALGPKAGIPHHLLPLPQVVQTLV